MERDHMVKVQNNQSEREVKQSYKTIREKTKHQNLLNCKACYVNWEENVKYQTYILM